MAFVPGVVPQLRSSFARGSALADGPVAARSALRLPLAARSRRVVPSMEGSSGPVAQESAPAASEASATEEGTSAPYDPSGMTVEEFFEKSLGEWRSQRSSHNLAWTQFEAVTSDITISDKAVSSDEVQELCKNNNVDATDVITAIEMNWEGESDWDDDQEVKGSAVMAVVKDSPTSGRLLRSVGYAETIPAVGTWSMTPDGAFVLTTFYDAAAAEERIWFATPDLRLRVSNIRTSTGRGVVTASFSSEIRVLKRS